VRTRLLGSIDLAAEQLADDLAAAEALPFNSSYGEFACGDLSSSMLFNRSGDVNDALLKDYTGSGHLTAAGRAMPYVIGVVGEHFDLTTLRFARLMRLGLNSVIVPHRDYLELERRFTRIHVPLRTDEHCFNSEDDTVYRMRLGEVWYLDATRLHSAASFSPVRRIHLVLDFEEASDPRQRLRSPGDRPGAVAVALAGHVVTREPIGDAQRRALGGLAGILTDDNLADVLSILVKTCYQRDVPMGSIFGWLQELALSGGRPDVATHVAQLEKYLVNER
jgi:L-proline cis-4-hydroxylase